MINEMFFIDNLSVIHSFSVLTIRFAFPMIVYIEFLTYIIHIFPFGVVASVMCRRRTCCVTRWSY